MTVERGFIDSSVQFIWESLRLFALSLWIKLIFVVVVFIFFCQINFQTGLKECVKFALFHLWFTNLIVSAEPFKRISFKKWFIWISIQSVSITVNLTNCLILWMSICLVMRLFTFTVDRVFMQNVYFLPHLWSLKKQKWFVWISIPFSYSTVNC